MADITLPRTIPDAYVSKALAALNGLAGKEIVVLADLLDNPEEPYTRWSYSYKPQQAGETLKDFAARALNEHDKALVRLFALAEDKIREIAERDAVIPASQDVPDDIII